MDIPRELTTILENHSYTPIRLIGRGGFACCYLVQSMKYSTFFVAKHILKFPSASNGNEREVETLKALCHPNIIRMYDFFWDQTSLYIIFEYCSGGSLQDILSNDGPIQPPKLYEYFYQALQGLNHCHSRNIAQDDIKPANILIDSNGRIKLTDFGLSCFFPKGQQSENFSGSRAFASPEMLASRPYDPFKADIWALGITFYYLSTGKIPWPLTSVSAFKEAVTSCHVDYPSTIEPKFVEVLSKTILYDPNKRATCEELLQIPFVQQYSPQFKVNAPPRSYKSLPISLLHKTPLCNARLANKVTGRPHQSKRVKQNASLTFA